MQVFGTATKPLINWLLPPQFRSNVSEASEPSSPKESSLDSDFHIPLLMDTDRENNGVTNGVVRLLNNLPRPSSIGMLLTAPNSRIHGFWRKFDTAYMRPLFGGRGFVRMMSRRMAIPEEDEDEALEEPDYYQQ